MSENSKEQTVRDSERNKVSDLGLAGKDDIPKNVEELTKEVKRKEEIGQNPITVETHTQSPTQQQKDTNGKEQEHAGKSADEAGSPNKNYSRNDEHQHIKKPLGTPPPEVEPSKFESPTVNDKVKGFIRFVKDFNQAILITTDSKNGHLKSRPMYVYNRVQDIYFYLLSKNNSNLVSDILADPKVNLAFQQGDKSSTNWCSVSANATIVKDHHITEELYSSSVKNWLKDLGDKRNDAGKVDSRIVAILLEPRAIDYFLDNQSVFEKLKYSITSQKPAKYESETACHLSSDEIDSYMKVHGHPK